MAHVEMRPGDTLSLVWSSIQKTPFGTTPVESSFTFSYDDLLRRLQEKGKAGKARKFPTEGVRLSRVVSLSMKALKTGKWPTGSQIDKDVVFTRMISQIESLPEIEKQNITPNAKKTLQDLYRSKLLKTEQKPALKAILEKFSLVD